MDSKSLEGLNTKAEQASIAELPVKSFMGKCPVTVPEGSKIYTAIQMLANHHVSSAPVIDQRGKIIGIVSEHDLLIQTATKDVTEALTYTKDVITVTPQSKLKDALLSLYKNKLRRLPVVDGSNQVVGVVTRMDILTRLIGKEVK